MSLFDQNISFIFLYLLAKLNLLHFMWITYSLVIIISGFNFLYIKSFPQFLRQLFAFGKVHNSVQTPNNLFKKLEVPKRYFSHFYVFASIYIPSITLLVCFKYFGICSCSALNTFLDVFSTPLRNSTQTVCPESVIIVGVLLSAQVLRRCYECFFISLYSDSKMNILHYIVGVTFYFGIGLSLIHDAPGFESKSDNSIKVYVTGQWFLWRHAIGIALFIAFFLLQFETHKSFAALRKKGDRVVTYGHLMPSGGGFDYVSCPHYFAEIAMYLSACIILGGKSYTWWLVCLWTVSNQICTGLVSHQWYKEKFKNYPPNRKAIIPFLL